MAFTTALIIAIGADHTKIEGPLRSVLACIPGILAAWCSILAWERRPRQVRRIDSQLAGNLIAIPGAGLVVILTYVMLDEIDTVSLTRHAAISLFLFLAFFVIPHFRKEGSLEMYVVRLFTHAAVSVLFSAVMFIGLSAITFTISSLFNLQVDFDTYARIWAVMAGTFAPFLFMAGIPKGTVSESTEDYPRVLKNLVLFVVTPLVAAYTLVLYVYFAKILITREWPIGLVGHLVLWYSTVSSALLFFVWPVSSENKWGAFFSKHFPRAVLPLLLMMLASVGIRIRHYGMTENRYYVLVFGLWVLGAMLYLSIAKARRKSLALPISLAVVIALSVFGPFSSFSISKWSQNRRLESLLAKHDMLRGQEIIPAAQEVPLSDRQEIVQILFYFDRSHELSDVRVLPRDFKMADFENVFGFSAPDAQTVQPPLYVRYESEDLSLDVVGFQYLFDFTRSVKSDGPVISLQEDDLVVEYDSDKRAIAVTLNGSPEWEMSLLEYLRGLPLELDETDWEAQFVPEDMVLNVESANLRFKVVVTNLWGKVNPESGRSLDGLRFYLLVGRK